MSRAVLPHRRRPTRPWPKAPLFLRKHKNVEKIKKHKKQKDVAKFFFKNVKKNF